MTNAVLNGKPYAGNLHVRFDVGGRRIGKSWRGPLHYKWSYTVAVATVVSMVVATGIADTVTLEDGGSVLSIPGPLCSAGEGTTFYWSDHLAPHPGADYIAKKNFRTPIDNTGKTWTFEGDSIDFAGIYAMQVKTLLPSKLVFTNVVKFSKWGVWSHNQGLDGAADFTAKLFSIGQVDLRPSVGSYEGGFHLHGAVVSDTSGGVAASSGYISLTGKPAWPTTFVDFDGDCSGFKGSVRIADATLTGSSGFPNASYVQMISNATIKVKASGFTVNALCGSKTGKLLFDSSTGTLGTLTLTGSLENLTGKVKMLVSDLSKLLPAGGKFSLVRRKITSGRLDMSHFEFDELWDALPYVSVSTEDDGDCEIVYLTVDPVVLAQKSGTMTNTGADYIWSDVADTMPEGGKIYLVPASTSAISVRTAESSSGSPYPKFLGDALVLGGSGAELYVRELAFEVPRLYALPGSKIKFYEQMNNTLSGHLILPGGEFDASVLGMAFYGRQWTFATEMSGSGAFAFSGDHTSSAPGTTVKLTGANTNYTGRLKVKMSLAGTFDGEAYGTIYSGKVLPNLDTYGFETISVSDARSLGGVRESFAYNGLELTHMSQLTVSETMTLDAANRGVYINEYGRINVSEGKTLTLKWPVTYNGIFRKEGTGNLALGAKSRFAPNDNLDDAMPPTAGRNQFRVMAGNVQPLTATAFSGLSVQFADGAGIVVDPTVSDVGARARGIDVGSSGALSVAGATLPVSVSGTDLPDYFTVGVITVPSSAVDTISALRSKLTPLSLKGYTMKVVDNAAEGGETVTFSLEGGRSGFLLLVR